MLVNAVSNVVTISIQKYKHYIIFKLQPGDQDIKMHSKIIKNTKKMPKTVSQSNTDMVTSNMAILATIVHTSISNISNTA